MTRSTLTAAAVGVSPPSPTVTGNRELISLVPASVFEGASIFQVVFSFAAMLGACLAAWMFYALRTFAIDPDVWWHVKNGQVILATHRWPTTDPYSFTAAGRHWLAYEWVGDVLLAACYRVGGLRGLGALLIILAVLFALALYYYATIRCGNPKTGFLARRYFLVWQIGSTCVRRCWAICF